MTCREFIDFIVDFLSGDLPQSVRERFEEHLVECPSCVAYLDSYERTVRVAKQAFREEDGVPEDVPPELVEAILDARRRHD